jgi:folylpolyglutamate synthase/dihydropteroate synthase
MTQRNDDMADALPTTLAAWLQRCERLHPKEIDMTLERTRQVV